MTEEHADRLMARVVKVFPDLEGLPHHILGAGFDSVALDVDGRFVFKFPRHQEAEQALLREAALLGAIRGRLTMPLPDLVLIAGNPLFSRHHKIPGAYLLSTDYDRLDEAARARLASDLALFYAEMHALDPEAMRLSGARPVKPWLPDDDIRAAAESLSAELRTFADDVLAAVAALPPDPYGEVFGMFDTHGWNMAFDHAAGRLNGLYDFADSGFGPLHQDFIYPAWISADLMARIIHAYEARTGRAIDRHRVHLLAAQLRLSEFAEFSKTAPADAEAMATEIARFAALRMPD
jgi:hypothetical protein